MSNSSQRHGLQPTRLLRPWDFPGKSTGVGYHPPQKIKQEKDGGTHRSFCPANHPGRRVETYLGFQQVITGFMVWWLWSIVRASRSQWRTQSWRKMGSLQRQGAGVQGDPVRATFFTTVATETGLVLAPGWRAVARLWVCGTISCAQQ